MKVNPGVKSEDINIWHGGYMAGIFGRIYCEYPLN
jgi:hypothetical protein